MEKNKIIKILGIFGILVIIGILVYLNFGDKKEYVYFNSSNTFEVLNQTASISDDLDFRTVADMQLNLKMAIYSNNEDNCNLINVSETRELCQNYYNECDGDCYLSLAYQLNNISFCNYIIDYSQKKYCEMTLNYAEVRERALLEENETICENNFGGDLLTMCISEVNLYLAQKYNSMPYCDKITDNNLKSVCVDSIYYY